MRYQRLQLGVACGAAQIKVVFWRCLSVSDQMVFGKAQAKTPKTERQPATFLTRIAWPIALLMSLLAAHALEIKRVIRCLSELDHKLGSTFWWIVLDCQLAIWATVACSYVSWLPPVTRHVGRNWLIALLLLTEYTGRRLASRDKFYQGQPPSALLGTVAFIRLARFIVGAVGSGIILFKEALQLGQLLLWRLTAASQRRLRALQQRRQQLQPVAAAKQVAGPVYECDANSTAAATAAAEMFLGYDATFVTPARPTRPAGWVATGTPR